MLTTVPQRPVSPSGDRISTATKPMATIHEMNPIARQESAIPINSDCGNVTTVIITCGVTATDRYPWEAHYPILEWRSPLELWERHWARCIGWMAGWETSLFLRTSFHVGVKEAFNRSLNLSSVGIPAMGGS